MILNTRPEPDNLSDLSIIFERDGPYSWPGNTGDAWDFASPPYTSTKDFFSSRPFLRIREFDTDEKALEHEQIKEAMFQGAREWEFPWLVTSAVYHILTFLWAQSHSSPLQLPIFNKPLKAPGPITLSMIFRKLQIVGTPLTDILAEHPLFAERKDLVRQTLLNWLKSRKDGEREGRQLPLRFREL